MFEDRTKKYDFNKIDSVARTKIITENKQKEAKMTDAQKILFSTGEKKLKEPILTPHKNVDVKNLPSSKYLQSFSNNLTVGEAEEINNFNKSDNKVEQEVEIVKENILEENNKEINDINFENLIEESNEIKVDEKLINKELKNISPAPKKSYSFRIKLVTGVYCILVALFGGWVIGNAIDIANVNANIYETIQKNKEFEANIEKIVLKIKNFNDASKDPEDDSIIKEIITESIETTPEAIIEPNEYVVESNWFDAFCNWLSKIFGGK